MSKYSLCPFSPPSPSFGFVGRKVKVTGDSPRATQSHFSFGKDDEIGKGYVQGSLSHWGHSTISLS